MLHGSLNPHHASASHSPSQDSAFEKSMEATSGVVGVDCGNVVGRWLKTDVWAFTGIPYAAPPVGDLRWQPPVGLKAAGKCWKARPPPLTECRSHTRARARTHTDACPFGGCVCLHSHQLSEHRVSSKRPNEGTHACKRSSTAGRNAPPSTLAKESCRQWSTRSPTRSSRVRMSSCKLAQVESARGEGVRRGDDHDCTRRRLGGVQALPRHG